jgi:hypothetical protein
MNANRIARLVGRPGNGGGLHRDELEYLMGVTPGQRKSFTVALMAAYRRGLICFCGPYVCSVPGGVVDDRFVAFPE